MARVLLVASIALVHGCGLTSRDFHLQLAGSDGSMLQLSVIDSVGIVKSIADGAPQDLVVGARPIDFRVGDGRRLALGWELFPCDRGATLTLREDLGTLVAELESTPNDQTCDAMGIGYGVTLSVTRAPDASRICAYVVRNGERHSQDSARCA